MAGMRRSAKVTTQPLAGPALAADVELVRPISSVHLLLQVPGIKY